MNFKYPITSIMLLMIVLSVTSFQNSFAENFGMDVTVMADEGSDMIQINGKTMSMQGDVTIRITSPSGSNVVDVAQVQPDRDGNFDAMFRIGELWKENGFYTIDVKHGLSTFYDMTVYVEVNNGMAKETSMTESLFNTALDNPVMEMDTPMGLSIEAEAIVGSTTIGITGMTDKTNMDVTVVVNAPNENIVNVDQIRPDSDGNFAMDISTGGPLWKQDGDYVVTAQQGEDPEYMDSVIVEIEDGVIVPEFGTIAVMILLVAIISIIAITSRSKLSIIPRY